MSGLIGQEKRLTLAQRVEAQALADEIAADETLIDEIAFEVVALRAVSEALEDAADMLHECALECAHCNYGRGATGKSSDGGVCEECSPIREAEHQARKALGDDDV